MPNKSLIRLRQLIKNETTYFLKDFSRKKISMKEFDFLNIPFNFCLFEIVIKLNEY